MGNISMDDCAIYRRRAQATAAASVVLDQAIVFGSLYAVEDHHGPASPAPRIRVHCIADVVDADLPRTHCGRSDVVEADGCTDAECGEGQEDEKLANHCCHARLIDGKGRSKRSTNECRFG